MIAEFGIFSLCWALIFALGLVFIPSYGLYNGRDDYINSAGIYVKAIFIFIAIAYGCLTYCFLTSDFTVSYVLKNSSIDLPWFYKLCAVWGGHEGSMLLWVMILSIWMLAVSLLSNNLDNAFRARVLIVLGFLMTGFILFLLVTSNPFARQFEILDTKGQDLNPLLQDPGFLLHPPMLYMGYVGFAVAFAFSITALWLGEVKNHWAQWARPWTIVAWSFLTAGITLGSWWAYRELGWGGFWFWDPVENASFMPWLVGTALIHSLIMCEKRGQFVAWTMLLAILGFSLSLVGTFLVRSGVLTSVHAFAVDPLRGMYILGFLIVVVGGSLTLFAIRSHKLYISDKPYIVSRESGILLNNIFLVVAMFTVLMGTVYPLLIDGLGLGKLSVGAPYFNSVFLYILLPMVFVMGGSIHLRWGKDNLKNIFSKLNYAILISIILPFIIIKYNYITWSATLYIGLFCTIWLTLTSLQSLLVRIRDGRGFKYIKISYVSMLVAHLGIAFTILGIVISSSFGIAHDVKLSPGDTAKLGNYSVKFLEDGPLKGANFHGTRAVFSISNGNYFGKIYPEKRVYNVTKMAMTDSDIDVGVFRDIYIALGEPLDDTAWSVRMYYKPFIRFIWFGGFMVLIGGLLGFLGQIKSLRKLLSSAANDSIIV